jgi:UDP-N-acetylmuramate: L-alanyl-gamma-D-glutamyl-meso-diaminopimelate ligase
MGQGNDARIEDFVESPEGARFRLSWRGAAWGDVSWNLPGIYNARNAAMAAVAAGLALYPSDPRRLRLAELGQFRGVKRRQEIRAVEGKLTVVEDFGHHPTAIAATLKSFRARFPGSRLTAVFEPRSNTARVKALQNDFLAALADADEIYLGPVSRGDKLSTGDRFDAPSVAASLGDLGRAAQSFPSNQALLESLRGAVFAEPSAARVVVFFSNGSFDGIIGRFADEVKASAIR